MYLVINKWVIAVNFSNFSGQYLRNHWTLDIGVLGYIGIVWPKEHSPEVWSVPPVTPCIYTTLDCDLRWTIKQYTSDHRHQMGRPSTPALYSESHGSRSWPGHRFQCLRFSWSSSFPPPNMGIIPQVQPRWFPSIYSQICDFRHFGIKVFPDVAVFGY